MRVEDRALAFAATPILRSDGTGPSAGILVFGRYLGKAQASHLADMTQVPVEITLLDDFGANSSRCCPTSVREWAVGSRGSSDLFVYPRDSSHLDGHTVLRDVVGSPLMLLSATVNRDALDLGKRTVMAVIGALVAGFAAVVITLLTILNRTWRIRENSARQRLEQERKLSRLARRDVLTGLPNRLHLQRLLPRLIARAGRDESKLALLYIDLDHFKNINDSLGHGTGDRLLESIAQRLRASVAADDLVVRMGGDEFVVVTGGLPNVSRGRFDRQAHPPGTEPGGADRRRVAERRAQHRHQRVPGRRHDARSAAEARGHRAVPGEGPRPRQSPVLHGRDERAAVRAAQHRARAAQGARFGRAVARIPAVVRPAQREADRASRRCCAGAAPSTA